MNSFETLLADFAEKTGVTPEASGANSFDVVADDVLVSVQYRPERDVGFLRYDLDELHTRAVLAALMTKKGPVPPDVFVRNLALLQEDEVQKHKDALLKAPLGAPTELDSGSKFAELIMGAFKDGSTSAWENVAEPEPVNV